MVTQDIPGHATIGGNSSYIKANTQTIIGDGNIQVGPDGIAFIGDNNIVTIGDVCYDVTGLENPYPGLSSYTYDQRDLYAGQQSIIQSAVNDITAVGEQRALLFITGASGSGKSSLAIAGILPALECRYAKLNLTTGPPATFRPSTRPLNRLAEALSGLGLATPNLLISPEETIGAPDKFNAFVHDNTRDGRINLLVLDQFEELFIQSEAKQRDALFAILAGLPAFQEIWTHIVVTLRSDYLSDLFNVKALYNVYQAQSRIDLREMAVDDLKLAIQRPLQARAAQDNRYRGKAWDPALVERLAQDAAANATYLPLLQATLKSIWDGGRLTRGAYDKLNSDLTTAIKQWADDVYHYADPKLKTQERSPRDQEMIMSIFLALVHVSLDGDDHRDVRRRRSRAGLENAIPGCSDVIDVLLAARLLSITTETEGTQSVEYIDIIHESLIRNWGTLRKAIDDKRQELQMQARFEDAMALWRDEGRIDRYLLDGFHLDEARQLAQARNIALQDDDGRELFRRSEARDKSRRRRRLIWSALGGAGLVAVLATIAFLEWRAQTTATQRNAQERFALSRRLAVYAAANTNAHPDLALLLGTAATLASDADDAAAGSLLDSLSANPHLLTLVHGVSGFHLPNPVTFSPDGALLAEAGENTVVVQDVAHLAQSQIISDPSVQIITSIALTAHSSHRWLAAGTDTGAALWYLPDARHAISQALRSAGNPDGVGASSVAFSANSRWLAAGYVDGTIRLWRMGATASAPLTLASPVGDMSQKVNSLAFASGPHGRWLAAGYGGNVGATGRIVLWDVNASPPISYTPGNVTTPIQSVAFSRDGHWLATGAADDNGTISLWNMDAVRPTLMGQSSNGGAITSLAISPNSTLLAVSSGHTISLWTWSVANRRQVLLKSAGSLPSGQWAAVNSVAFNPRDTRPLLLAAGSEDGTVLLWDASQRCSNLWDPTVPPACDEPLAGSSRPINGLALDPRSARLAAAGNKAILLWDLSSRARLAAPIRLNTSSVMTSAAFGSNGRRQWLAAGGAGGALLWDLNAWPSVSRPLLIPATKGILVNSVAIDRAGTLLALAPGQDRTRPNGVMLVELPSGRSIGKPWPLESDQLINDVAFSPQLPLLATAGTNGVRLWNLTDYRHPLPRELSDSDAGTLHTAWSVAFSPNGSSLAAGYGDGTIRLWDVASRTFLGQLGSSNPNGPKVYSVAFGHSGHWLAAGLENGSIELWDVDAQLPIGHPIRAGGGGITGLVFTSGGARPVSGRADDDTRLIVSSADATVRQWDTSITAWQRRACYISNRRLTRHEQLIYLTLGNLAPDIRPTLPCAGSASSGVAPG